MLSELQQGQKLLILRYGNQIIEDCIAFHQEKINSLGYCWFGKIGTVPSKKTITSMLEEKKPALILYSRYSAFICEVCDVIYDTPESGIPDYYQTELYDKFLFPKVYFKLSSINSLDINTLDQFTVISSGNTAIKTLMHSMSSFLFVSYSKPSITVAKTTQAAKEGKREKLSSNDCVYRHDGICELRGFVNYKYECNRPTNCIKQKR